MKNNRKAQGRMWWIIIVAVVAIVVMIIVLIMFHGGTGKFKKGLYDCRNNDGICELPGEDKSCPEGYKRAFTFTCENPKQICCFKKE